MPGYLDSPYAILDNYGDPGDSTTLDPTEEAKQRYAQAMPEPAPQASESYGGGGQQFGGYNPQPDTQTVGGSQAQMGSPAPAPAPLPSAPQAHTGGDPFQGNNPYQGAMPQTDAAQQYLDEELRYRREHQPSMLRKVLGTAASMYSPQIGRMIMDPRGHEEQFQRNMPLYQAKSKLEQDELTKQATIAQKRASDAYRASTEADRRNTELDRQDAGTENVPIENTPSSVTLPSGPPPLGPPQGPPDPMAPPPDNPPLSLLASMRNPTVSVPPGAPVPLPVGYKNGRIEPHSGEPLMTPVSGGRPVPAGMQKVRPTALGVATAKAEAAKVDWIPTPTPIMEKYPNAPPSMPKEVLDTYVRAIESGDRAAADLAMRKSIADESNATRRDIASASDTTRREVAGAAAPARQEAALDREVNSWSKPHQKSITDAQSQLEKIADARAMINGNAEAQALGIPKVLTSIVGGQGSGVRITKSEQDAIASARGLGGDLQGWLNKVSGQGKLTATQQQQLSQILDDVASRVKQKQQIANDAIDEMGSSGSRQEIIAADKKARQRVAEIERSSGGSGKERTDIPSAIAAGIPEGGSRSVNSPSGKVMLTKKQGRIFEVTQ